MIGDMGNFGWGMGFGWLFMILFWGLIILGIVAVIKWLAISSRSESRDKTPLEILKERYARGEIGRDEYEQKKLPIEVLIGGPVEGLFPDNG